MSVKAIALVMFSHMGTMCAFAKLLVEGFKIYFSFADYGVC